MKWLQTRIHGWKRRHEETEGTVETVDEQAGAESRTPDSSCPRLILLVQDAAGLASYRLHTFEDAPSAAAFVQFWFPPKLEHGILAFWAMHQEPIEQAGSNEERPAEVVVLIRDEARPEIVYPFSCPDLGLAHSWIAKEASRGLDLRLVMVYWAASARIETDGWGVVRLSPATPPMARAQNGTETGGETEPALQETEVAFEATADAVETANLQVEETEGDVRVDTPMMLEEVDAAPREEVEPAGLQAIKGNGDQRIDDETLEVEVEAKAEVSPEEEETVALPAQNEPPWEAEDGETAEEAEEEATDGRASTADNSSAAQNLADALEEINKVVRKSRWEQQEGPFRGFGSPRGKF